MSDWVPWQPRVVALLKKRVEHAKKDKNQDMEDVRRNACVLRTTHPGMGKISRAVSVFVVSVNPMVTTEVTETRASFFKAHWHLLLFAFFFFLNLSIC